MPKVNIDNLEFNTEDFDDDTVAIFQSLQYTQVKLRKLEQRLLVLKVSHDVYASNLKKMIETPNKK